jgi:hypothetical protein
MKKFTWSLCCIIGLLFSLSVSAQKNKQGSDKSYPQFSLHTSLTSFLDYDAGLMLGIGYRWNKRFSASLEPTWIFYSFYTDRATVNNPSGIKIRADLKYHFNKRKPRSPDFYMAPEFHFKHTKTKIEDRFGINCQGGQCAFFQNAIYTDIKKEIGGLVKAGMIYPLLFVKNHRWLIDMYVGLGVKQMNYRETDLPVGGSFVNPPFRSIFNNQGDRYAVPSVPVGFKLIFIL